MFEDAVVLKAYPNMTAMIKYIDSGETVDNVRVSGRVIWNVQKDDIVLVGFIGGLPSNPFIFDVFLLPNDPRSRDNDQDDIHLLYEGKEYDHEGNETIISRFEVLKDQDGGYLVKASGRIRFEASGLEDEAMPLEISVTGDVDISAGGNANVSAIGDVNVNAEGKVNIQAADTIDIDGANGVNVGDNLVKLLVNNYPKCLFAGTDHALGNTKVKV